MPMTILATDLDGTFLGGSAANRAALYGWIAAHRQHIVLIFVSGRGIDFMRGLARELPIAPDHVIGDVGTSVASGADFARLRALDDWLDAAWPADAPRRIRSALRGHTDLQQQSITGGRRCSYFYRDEAAARAAASQVQAMGFDPLLSDNRFFDVLPRGVQKGPTLLRLLDTLGLPPHRTLVAGDTLNDLSMFATGLAGVAVANREPALDAALAAHPHVHRSTLPGAAGVLDALQRFHHRGTPHGIATGHRLSPATV